MANAKIITISGKAEVIKADGAVRPLRVGEVVQGGDIVRTQEGGRVELVMDDGQLLALGALQTLRVDDTMVQAGTDSAQAAAAQAATIDQIIQILEPMFFADPFDDLVEFEKEFLGASEAKGGD